MVYFLYTCQVFFGDRTHEQIFLRTKSWHDYQALEQGSLARKNCQFFAIHNFYQGKLARLYTGISLIINIT